MWWLRGRSPWVLGAGALAVACVIAVGGYFLVETLRDDSEAGSSASIVVGDDGRSDPPTHEGAFPALATKNTIRIPGPDPTADAAGAALAVFPSTGGVEGPPAVTFVSRDDWASGIAAASLMAAPIGAPLLFTDRGSVPAVTADAASALAPAGADSTGGAQAFRIGSAGVPAGLRTKDIGGSDPVEIAAAIDEVRESLTGAPPKHVLLVSADSPEFSMPAASWAARSGDPVLFVRRDSVPKPTLEALRQHGKAAAFVLGPPSIVSDATLKEVGKASASVRRVGAEDPVENAIEFARYSSGSFGWNIRDPGHGFVIASVTRPLDAGAAAPLSASGDWGPLLVTDDGEQVPTPLREYLLDVKPGYLSNPTRAVYNHVWLIGDERVMSIGFQAQTDELAELVKVRSGAGDALLGVPPEPNPSPARPTKPSRPSKP